MTIAEQIALNLTNWRIAVQSNDLKSAESFAYRLARLVDEHARLFSAAETLRDACELAVDNLHGTASGTKTLKALEAALIEAYGNAKENQA